MGFDLIINNTSKPLSLTTYKVNEENIILNSAISTSISVITLLLILFIYTPQEWFSIVSILTLIQSLNDKSYFLFLYQYQLYYYQDLIFAPHNSYDEKDSAFECGFHSFLGKNRSEFSISFFIFALLFSLFDLEILLVYPYVVSAYVNGIFGLIVMLIFFLVLTLGFVFELGKNALTIESRQKN